MEHSLQDILRAVNAVLSDWGLRSSCVQASTILTEVLKRSGYSRAYPLTTSVEISNAALLDWAIKYGGPPRDEESLKAYRASGAAQFMIDMSAPVEGKQWPGHLVVIVPGYFGKRHLMLDLTIEQCNRPDEGIILKQLDVEVGDDFVAGMAPFSEIIDGCHLVYKAHPDDRTYEDIDGSMKLAGLNVAIAFAMVRLQNGSFGVTSIGEPDMA